MSRRYLYPVLALALLAILGPVAPAAAEIWSARDARGDVNGFSYVEAPSPEECPVFTDVDGSADSNDDITRLTVRHNRARLVAKVRFRALDRTLDQSLTLHLKTPGRGWSVEVDRSEARPGRFRTFVMLSREPRAPALDSGDGDCVSVTVMVGDRLCPDLRGSIDFDRDAIRVSVPRACIRDPRWVRVGAGANGFEYLDPPADQPDLLMFNGYSDMWSPDGSRGTDWLPPFGPRLRVRDGDVS